MVSKSITFVILGIWIFLTIASLIVWSISKFKPTQDFHELKDRTKSWWIMLAIFTFAIYTNRVVSLVFFALISFLALKEFFSIISTRRADHRALFFAYLAIPYQYYLVHTGWYGMFIIFIPVYMFFLIPFCLLLTQQTEGFLKSVGTIQWGLMITVFALSHISFLLALPSKLHPQFDNAGLLLYLVLLTQLNDVFQYVWGKLLGKHKIIPLVSPKKTWEGFLGGVVTTTLLAIVIYTILTPFTLKDAILTGIIVSVGGFIGDITISAIKRDLHIKDTSALIPGHGGILDRVDSLTVAAPLFFHFVHYFYY